MGSFLSRALLMSFGYAYPAYECFKEVEKSNPEIEQLLFWCQYWFLVAVFTVCERVGDALISWFPMYSEAKLAFLIYLWYPRTKGTRYVYGSFFQPSLAKHQADIDQMLLELRAKAGNIALLFWQNVASYGQTRFLEILQYCSSQSSSLTYNRDKQQHMVYTNGKPLVHRTTVSIQSAEEESSAAAAANELQRRMPSEEAVQEETTSKEANHSRRGRWRLFPRKDS